MFTTLEPEDESKFAIKTALVQITVALLSVPLLLFVVFLVGRVVSAQPPRHPSLVGRVVTGTQPDAVYTQASLASDTVSAAQPPDNIIYFAPTAATLPVLVSSDQPPFPKGTLAEGCSDTVKLRIMIQPNGTPKDPAIRQKSDCGLDYPALLSVMNWKFRPGQMDGKPIPVGAWVEVHFRKP